MGKNTQSQETRSDPILKKSTSRMFSSGGVVFRIQNDKVCWLVRQTVASKEYPIQYWMLPKGWIDDAGPGIPGPIASGKVKAKEEDLVGTALREVAEEGGIKAEIVKKIGTSFFTYTDPKFGRVIKFVTFYLMKYIGDNPNGHDNETSEVSWLSYEAALKKLSFNGEKDMLRKANELFSSFDNEIGSGE
jgi:8-oxo-dGTP pyrophosphatase MutT (NUDIX family)